MSVTFIGGWMRSRYRSRELFGAVRRVVLIRVATYVSQPLPQRITSFLCKTKLIITARTSTSDTIFTRKLRLGVVCIRHRFPNGFSEREKPFSKGPRKRGCESILTRPLKHGVIGPWKYRRSGAKAVSTLFDPSTARRFYCENGCRTFV